MIEHKRMLLGPNYREGMQVGFTSGSMDLLHAGHILMLSEARAHCDYLVVALQGDPTIDRKWKNQPVQTLVERQIQLRGCKFVDEVWIYNTEQELEDLLRILPISVRFVGEEYRDTEFTGHAICKLRGIKIHYNQRQHGYSSSELRQRTAAAEQPTHKESS